MTSAGFFLPICRSQKSRASAAKFIIPGFTRFLYLSQPSVGVHVWHVVAQYAQQQKQSEEGVERFRFLLITTVLRDSLFKALANLKTQSGAQHNILNNNKDENALEDI